MGKSKVRLFLFKILFRLTWWVSPNRPRVNKIFEIYEQYVKAEEDHAKCQQRQSFLDKHIRPRTETYEYLSCKKQRDLYTKYMPPRFKETKQPRSHYSDYEEAKAYHNS
tara:strand:+ start:155 stop:481 length:327 start_codon:yes stop_codon:yes gene_type:complete